MPNPKLGARPGAREASELIHERSAQTRCHNDVTYTADGAKGLLAKGGTARRSAVEECCRASAARSSFYFAFGDPDFYVVADSRSGRAAAVGLTVAAAAACARGRRSC